MKHFSLDMLFFKLRLRDYVAIVARVGQCADLIDRSNPELKALLRLCV